MPDNEMMSLEKALFILRYGSAEGEHKYFEAIAVIENKLKSQEVQIEALREQFALPITEEDEDWYSEPPLKTPDEIRADAVKEVAEALRGKGTLYVVGNPSEPKRVVWFEKEEFERILNELTGVS